MRTIPQTFTKRGWTHSLVAQSGPWRIFCRRHPEVTNPHFEVVKIGLAKATTFLGHQIEEGETYPSSEEWGRRGFTFPTLEAARAKVEALNAERLLAKNMQPK